LPPLTETFMFLLSKFVYSFFSAFFCITAFGVVCKAYEKMIQGIALARIPDVMLCPGWQGAEQKGETSDPIWGIM
jgi:hypothetical protein